MSDHAEVRMLASGGHQRLGTPSVVREQAA
nr:hypothetical protein [Streptomyces sp. A0958]